MLCQDCKKREAAVKLTQIVNNEKMTISLCKECAAARGFHSPLDNVPFPLAEILSGMAETLPSSTDPQPPQETLVCKNCELTFEQFTRQGRFGCGECYAAFRPRLESIMRKIHGASLHRGRSPEMTAVETDDHMRSIPEEERLRSELKKAIEAEEFERAAELRDKLKATQIDVEMQSQE